MSNRDILFFSLMALASVWAICFEYVQYRFEKECENLGANGSRRYRVMGYAGAFVIIGAAAMVRFAISF